MTKTLTNGIGETLGDTVVTCSPLLLDQEILFVDSTNPDAADVSGNGRWRGKPFATLVYAFSQAQAGDIIVLLDGHAETISTELDIDAAVTIVGAGQSDGKPTVKLTGPPADGTAMLLITADNVQVRNIWFEEHASSGSGHHIEVNACTNTLIKGCYFEANENNDLECIDGALGATDHIRLQDCTFVATSETPTNQAFAGVSVSAGLWELDNCVFDDGLVGFGAGGFFCPAPSSIRAFGISLLNGATFEYYEDANYFVHINASATDGLGGKVERNN